MSPEILLLIFLIGLVVGFLAIRFRWLRWNLWGRWHQLPPEPLYLLTVSQQVENEITTNNRTYHSAQVVSQSLVDDDLGLAWTARSLDGHLLTETGVVAEDRRWIMERW